MPSISPSDVLNFYTKFPTGDEAHFRQLPQDFQNALLNAGQEYLKKTGKKLQINSSYRTREEQRNAGPKAVDPDVSKHPRGLAVDIQQGGDPVAKDILKKYGIIWKNVKNDAVHYEFQRGSSGAADRGTASRKTAKDAAPNKLFNNPDSNLRFVLATESNILNQYNSWNYNFTIGCLPVAAVSDTIDYTLVDESINRYLVLTSKGKGNQKNVDKNGSSEEVSQMIDDYNRKSPGRFDLFIDDLEFDSIIGSGNAAAGSTQVMTMKFTVTEPYSMNGFIESLQVSSRAAGFDSYLNTPYGMKVEFNGYKDDIPVNELKSEIIPKSTRYFIFKFSQIEVGVSESGTKYRCSVLPLNNISFGNAGMLLTDLSVEGYTVGEVLCDFFKKVNESVKNNAKISKDNINAKHDFYEISCPKLASTTDRSDILNAMLYSPREGVKSSNGESNNYQNEIIKEKMNNGLSDPNLFKFSEPSQTSGYVGAKPEGGSAKTATGAPVTTQKAPAPGKPSFQFSAGSQISDCITSIIISSEYIRINLLQKQLIAAKNGEDKNVTYFTIESQTVYSEDFDIENNTYYYVYRYILQPYRTLYTNIPGLSQAKIDTSQVLSQIKREYQYIYTGKNTDIIKFQLKFDNLFYDAQSPLLGNKPSSSAVPNSATRTNPVKIAQPASATATMSNNDTSSPVDKTPSATIQYDRKLNSVPKDHTGQILNDSYQSMARTLHESILNNTSMITGELEILGDPYFLINGGMINEGVILDDGMTGTTMITNDGQAAVRQGDLFIQINFRNPIDISIDGANSGFVEFAPLLPFSGLYRVMSLTSNFKNGVFTQLLTLNRSQGIIDSGGTETSPNLIKSSPLPGEQKTEDTKPADVQATGIRSDSLGILNMLSRGLPNPVDNFINFATDAEAALSNAVGSVGNFSKSLVSDFSGLAGQAGELANQLSGGIDNIDKKISASAELFNSTIVSPNPSASAIAAVSRSISGTIGIDETDASTALATSVATQITAAGGSANSIVSDVNKSISNVVGKVDDTVGDVTNAISKAFNSSLSDPLAIADSLRIDTSKISGLLGPVGSQITGELKKISSLIPDNVDFGTLGNKGLMFKFITKDNIPNLPPAQPSVSAPKPLPDPALKSIINSFGSISGTLDNLTNLPALTDINKITNSVGSLSSGLDNISGAVQGLSDNIGTVNSIVNNVVGEAVGVVNSVGSRAQNAVSGVMPASVGLGSVESGALTIKSVLQMGSTPVNSSLDTTVISALGSKQSPSPLVKLIQNNNIQGST